MVGSVSKDDDVDDDDGLQAKSPKISGKIKLTFNAEQETEQSMEVDADAYMAELRGQVLVLAELYYSRSYLQGVVSCSWCSQFVL